MSQTVLARKSATPAPVVVTKNLATTFERGAATHLDRAKLAKLGYGEAALDTLEAGVPISYGETDTPPDHSIQEYPDGRRYLVKTDWLAAEKVWRVETVKRLGDAPR